MAAAIQLEMEVSPMAIADFKKAIARYQAETQRSMRDALYSSTTDLLKGLRRRTRQAKKLMPKSAFRFGTSDPKYFTNEKGKYRRMVRKDFPPEKDYVFWQKVRSVYSFKRLKNGGLSEGWKDQNEAQILADARKEYGIIWNWGMAKRTWGWVMWKLFNLPFNGSGFDNKRCNITHRHAEGSIIERRTPLPDGSIDLAAPVYCEINIINRLRYIRKALMPGALAESIQKATNSINKKIDNGLVSRRFGS